MTDAALADALANSSAPDIGGPPPAGTPAAAPADRFPGLAEALANSSPPGEGAPAPTPLGAPPAPPSAPHRPRTRFQQSVAPPPRPAPPEPSWGQVATGAAQNLLPSLGGIAGSMWGAVTHPGQTLNAMGQLASGAASQAAGALGIQQDPAQKKRQERVIQALEDHYASAYGSVGGFKQALMTDPASVAMDLASVLTMGGGAAAGAPGIIGKIGAAAAKAGEMIDPVTGALKAAALPARAIANPLTRAGQAITTGLPQPILKLAAQAGAETRPEMRAAFQRGLQGQVTPAEFQQRARVALGQVKQDASNAYLAGKTDLVKAPVDYRNAYSALDKADADMEMGAPAGWGNAKSAVTQARAMVDSVANDPERVGIMHADALKRQLWDDLIEPNPGAAKWLMPIYHGIRDDITAVDPAYADLMESYQTGLNKINDLTKTFGLGQNAAASASLAKVFRAMKKPGGEDLFRQLGEKDPALMYSMAGSAISPWHAGGVRDALEGALAFPWALWMHQPGIAAAQFALQSPLAMGAVQYGAAAAGRTARAVGLSPITKGIYYAGRAGDEAANPDTGETGPGATAPASQIAQQIEGYEQTGKNPRSSAEGPFQMINSTWGMEYRKAHPEMDFGNLTDQGIGEKYRYTPEGQAETQHLGENLVSENIAALGSHGVTPTPGAVYLAHFLGAHDALKVLKAEPGEPISNVISNPGKVFAANPFIRGKTVGWTQAWADRVMRQQADKLQRTAYASGGKVGDDIEPLLSRLISRANAAKKAGVRETKPLLQMPDETVAKALELAQRAI